MRDTCIPSFASLFHRAGCRRAAWRYWIIDPVAGAAYASVHYTFRLFSIDQCSAFGAAFGSFARRHIGFDLGEFRRTRRDEAKGRRNWLWLRPDDADPATVDAALEHAYRQGSQTYLEFSVLDRLWRSRRIAVQGGEHIAQATAEKRSVLVVSLHLGNWETIGPALIGLGYETTIIYQVPQNRFDHRLAVTARRRYGANLVPPVTPGARARHAFRALSNPDNVLLIYIDEFVNGRVHAPFFGRPRTPEGNIVNAVRLAAMTDAVVIPAFCIRMSGARFNITFLPAVSFDKTGDHDADLHANVAKLNAIIEPIVREHLDQWFWLFDIRPEA